MSDEDRYSVAEFARRYKVSEDALSAFCTNHDLTPETVLTREEFKHILADLRTLPAERDKIKEEEVPLEEEKSSKEEDVTEKKRPFSRWVEENRRRMRLSNPKVVYIKMAGKVQDSDRMTEQEFQALVDKYLHSKG
jgi:hypothetical protein